MCSEYGCCDGRCQDVAGLPEDPVPDFEDDYNPESEYEETDEAEAWARKGNEAEGVK